MGEIEPNGRYCIFPWSNSQAENRYLIEKIKEYSPVGILKGTQLIQLLDTQHLTAITEKTKKGELRFIEIWNGANDTVAYAKPLAESKKPLEEQIEEIKQRLQRQLAAKA